MKIEGQTIGSAKNTWRIGKELGAGACGSVHTLHNGNNKECSLYAVKVVELPAKKAAPKKKKSHQEIMAGLLSYEVMVYKGVLSSIRGKYIPDVPLFGAKGEPYPAYMEDMKKGFAHLVMERMEAPISKISDGLSDKETLGDVFLSMLECVRAVHNCGAIVVDLKPDNFMLAKGSGNISTKVRLIDFGLLKLCGQGGKFHEDMYPNAKMEGTPCYMSLNVMQGHTTCHRDDLEALCYIFMELLLSFEGKSLPWSNEQSDSKLCEAKEKFTLKSNSETSIFSIIKNIFGASVSSILEEYFVYTRGLKYAQKPDYDRVCKIIAPLKLEPNSCKSRKIAGAKSKSSDKRKLSLSDDDSVLEVTTTQSTRNKPSKTKASTKRKQIIADEESDSDESSVEVIVATTRRSTRRNKPQPSSKPKSNISSNKENKSIDIDIDHKLDDDSDGEYFSAHEVEIDTPSRKKGLSTTKDINMKVSIIKGPDQGNSFLIDQYPITIGRDPDENSNTSVRTSARRGKNNDNHPKTFTLNDPEASSKHALLSLQQQNTRSKSKHTYLRISDLYSTNGTYVNDNKLKKGTSHKLVSGDTFSFGRSTFLVSL